MDDLREFHSGKPQANLTAQFLCPVRCDATSQVPSTVHLVGVLAQSMLDQQAQQTV
jgi:hypothetical protein